MNNKISLENLTEMADGDNQFIIEMISLFIKQSNELITEIDDGLLSDDIETIKKVLHKLKSSAGLFKLENLIDIITKFETKNPDELKKADIVSTSEEVKKILKKACTQLQKEKNKILKV